MHSARAPRRLATITLLPLFLIALLVLVAIYSCQTDPSPGSAGPHVPEGAQPLPPPPESESERHSLAKYPQLLEDPEVIAAAGTPSRIRRPVTDPLIEELLASLSLRQRIGQRFIANIPGSRISYGAGRMIVEVAPAGFIVYPWNFESAEELARLTNSLQWLARSVTPGISLLLCADQEGGRVATFRTADFVRMPAARTMGQLGAESIEAGAYLTGVQMLGVGLNMNLAPVLDVYSEADSTIIGDRSYSGDPETVAGIVGPYLSGANRAGIISVAKHFPGHGITTVDSHNALPVVGATLEEIRKSDLVPFVSAIEAGIQVIMTSHILYESIDPFYPVTLSRVFLTDLLRGELGFDGVIMSDGLEMGAISNNYSLREALIRLFRNDVDLILLFVNLDVVDLVDQVEELVRTGEITEDEIDRGVRRVLRLKLENGLANPEVQ